MKYLTKNQPISDLEARIRENLQPIFGFCVRRTANFDDAMDLSQEILVEVVSSLPDVDPHGQARGTIQNSSFA